MCARDVGEPIITRIMTKLLRVPEYCEHCIVNLKLRNSERVPAIVPGFE
jgi:hypothetical protein